MSAFRATHLRMTVKRQRILARAIDNALNAASHQTTHLKPGHPPLAAPFTEGVKHYGGPGVMLDLWAMCHALDALSIAWLGKGLEAPISTAPVTPIPPLEEIVGPDEAVGKPNGSDGSEKQLPLLRPLPGEV